ncbi:FG-GAP repeat domain-containing protein [Desulfallas thermosapovorans]|uniref:FG-GAP repeat domain-containing protein n=1 Tax=Desulfallas thermosapovorans TaxID=58137 RepID=UPI00141300F4|nr:VCBS repeat-containing protein [Desulfallas thermosapovorans]
MVYTSVCFQPAVNYPVGFAPRNITAADFDNDGGLDLATIKSQHEFLFAPYCRPWPWQQSQQA